jgi:probable rRNA maturation factor
VLEVISSEGLAKSGEVGISFISDSRIKRLNSRFHNRNAATDVLAFDLSSGKSQLIADIYISADTAVKNSRVFSSEPACELYLYAIHGMLHIAGYDDHKPKDIKLMRKKEAFYLNKITEIRFLNQSGDSFQAKAERVSRTR